MSIVNLVCIVGVIESIYCPGNADVILANSKFTARVFKAHFPGIGSTPAVIHPGINLAAYDTVVADGSELDVAQVQS